MNSNNLLKDFTISKRGQDPRKNNNQNISKEHKEISIIGVPEGAIENAQNTDNSSN